MFNTCLSNKWSPKKLIQKERKLLKEKTNERFELPVNILMSLCPINICDLVLKKSVCMYIYTICIFEFMIVILGQDYFFNLVL